MNIRECIRDVPDFPKPGILFKDITTLLKDKAAFKHVIDTFAAHYGKQNVDQVVGIESRGIINGAPLA
jgi:adenine phosphoribosyltransferase